MEFKMTGLRADNPQGWLAAVGVIYRIVEGTMCLCIGMGFFRFSLE